MTAESTTLQAVQSCPVCGDTRNISALCRIDGAEIYSCATCTADHVFPMPSTRALKAYYDRREWFEGGEKGGYQDYDAQTAGSIGLLGSVLAPFAGRSGLSILDVGCGYGTHLAVAAKLGWKCFGVEPSDHARGLAQERLGGTAYVVESVTDLIPHEFDVVLLLDVIEHLPSPYPTFYQLFSIGAITPKTLIVITTPNAGSTTARRSPASWPYRHPASHLVHYSAEALRHVLQRLHFSVPVIRGLAPGTQSSEDLANALGLVVTAHGSDFAEFMRERYVPGTWSKIAEYEHIPRYALAKTLAAEKVVLDFGCGTGYGAAIMSEIAARVTGLDIDAAALTWAEQSHRDPRLSFERHDDLGASLPAASFDLVTCFEMIEHVDLETQKAVVASMGRLLRNDGLLIISTPNPEVTALYGANPHHLREMSEDEFRTLLSAHFPQIQILRQYVRVGIAIDHDNADKRLTPGPIATSAEPKTKPLAFIALCSRQPLPDVPNRVLFDQDIDFIEQFMLKEQTLNSLRLNAYRLGEVSQSLKSQFDRTLMERDAAQASLDETINRLMGREKQLMALEQELTALDLRALMERDAAQASLDETINRLMGREKQLMAREQELTALDLLRHHEKAVAAAALEALDRIRQDELSSPRFLGRQFLHATRARIRTIIHDRLSRLRGR